MPVEALDQPSARSGNRPPPLGLGGTLTLFGGAALLLFAATHGLIPLLAAQTGAEPVLLWFAVGGLGVFAPLLLAGWVMLRGETPGSGPDGWRRRLRFRPMTLADWVWSAAGLALIALIGIGTVAMLRLVWGDVPLHPPFLTMAPLTPGRYWILVVWLPFWALNVLGEEILWRGVVLPRQEEAFGRWAWAANGAGWLLFHVAFGPTILLTLLPIVFVLPYIVQRRQNSWIGVVIHAGVNGPGFLAVAFGLA